MSAPVQSTRVSTLKSEKKTIVGSVNLKLSGENTNAHTTLPLGTAGISRKGANAPKNFVSAFFPPDYYTAPVSSRSKNQNITGCSKSYVTHFSWS